MLRPLPPFRAKPARRPAAPKLPGEPRPEGDTGISVKAPRRPVRVSRLAPAPALKVLSPADSHA